MRPMFELNERKASCTTDDLPYRHEITPEVFHVPVKIRPLSPTQELSRRIRPVSR